MRQYLFFSFIVGISLVATLTLAQTADQVASRKVALESEIKLVEQQIAVQTKLLQITQQQGASLKRDVDILNGQINRAKLVIKQHQLEIVRLGGDIKQKSGTITELTGKIATIKISLADRKST